MPSRYRDRDRNELTAAQKAVLDAIEQGPRGGDMYRGPFKLLLENPDLAQVVQSVGSYIRYGSSPDDAVREVVILTVASVWRCDYEWIAHLPIAVRKGISSEDLEALRTGQQPDFGDPSLDLAYRLAWELSETHSLSDKTFDEATALFGQAVVLDLIATVGYYGLLAGLLNSFELELPEGIPKPFVTEGRS